MNLKWILTGFILTCFSATDYLHVQAKPRTPKYKTSRLTTRKSEAVADRRGMLLATGEDRVVDLTFNDVEPTNGITVGNPKIVATTLVTLGEKKQIVFRPLGQGRTTVTVRDVEGELRLVFIVRVTETNLMKICNELRQLLRDIDGIDIKIRGDKIFIDGEIMVPTDYGRLLNILKAENSPYTTHVMNLVTMSPLAMRLLSNRIQQDISGFAPNVSARVVNGKIWLEGSVDNGNQAARAAKVAELYLPDISPGNPLDKDEFASRIPARSLVQNFIVINPPPPSKRDKMVRVTTHFVELSKDYQKVFGFKWEPGFSSDSRITIGQSASGATGATTGGGPNFAATIVNLFPSLNNAQNAGYARVLKSGTVLVRSGQPASLNDEMVIPVLVQGEGGETTTRDVPIGLTLAVTPLILGQSDDIEMDVEMQQINLVGRSVASPRRAQHRVKTKIYVRANESAAIAGVDTSNIQTDFNKDDPNAGGFGGQTRSLFKLLRSKSYSKAKSQFVMFVTPQIVENASEGTKDLKKNFRVKVR